MKNLTLKNLNKTKELLVENGLATKEDNLDNMAINIFSIMTSFKFKSVEDTIQELVNKKLLANIKIKD